MTIQYGIGSVVIIYVLVTDWSSLGTEVKLPLLGGLILLPLAWVYFDRSFRNRISRTYEILDGHLVIKEWGTIKHKIPISSIQELNKVQNGYQIKSYSGTAFIPNGIEGNTELLKQLEPLITKSINNGDHRDANVT